MCPMSRKAIVIRMLAPSEINIDLSSDNLQNKWFLSFFVRAGGVSLKKDYDNFKQCTL